MASILETNSNHNILNSPLYITIYNNQSFYNTLHQYTTTCTGLHTTTVKTALRLQPLPIQSGISIAVVSHKRFE